MNDEERQYWINILPIMTPEQIGNLQEILVSEREQLSAIDRKYSKEIQTIGQQELLRRTEEKRREKRTERQKAEHEDEHREELDAEALLKEIEGA
jgi:isopropylmalate/homocitrate/citramalate synthase